MPETGAYVNGLIYDGFTYVSDIAASAAPEALPGCCASLAGLTGRNRQTILDQMAVSGASANGGHPAALPRREPDKPRIAQFWSTTDPDGFYAHECDSATTTGMTKPSVLPQTGAGQAADCVQFWSTTDPDGFYTHECDSATTTGMTEPSALPRAGGWRGSDRSGAEHQ